MDFARDLAIIRETVQRDTAMAEVGGKLIAQALDELTAARENADDFLLAAMRLFACAGNGHTRIIPNETVQVFPMRTIWAGDALWAMGEATCEITAINDLPVMEIFNRLAPFLAGTPARQKVIGGLPMVWPAALRRGGLPDCQTFTYRFRDASSRTFDTEDGCPAADFYPQFETGFSDPETDPYTSDRPNVLRLNAFTTQDEAAPEKRLDQASKTLSRLENGPLIIDLRGNPGGDFLRHLPILDAVKHHAGSRRIGVLVDRFTFSAAIVFVALCRARLNAAIIGEEMGDRESFHAEGDVILLPDSGAHLRWSDGFHDWKSGIPRASTPPDIAAVMEPCGSLGPDLFATTTPADLAIGSDPALDAAFSHLKGPSPCAP